MRVSFFATAIAVPALLIACGARSDPAEFDLGSGGSAGVGGTGGTGGGPPVCTVELCNGVDDDCDGQVDEDSQNAGADCIADLPGICKDGTVVCAGGALACASDVSPKPEICGNGIDEDCNGIIDDACVKPNGCSDGTREGFVDEQQFPLIAACSGGWSVPGIHTAPVPQCNHVTGNTSPNPNGNGCSAADLCSPGFHVCKGADDVASHAPDGCFGVGFTPNVFFATGQGSTGCGICTLGTNTDPDICNGCSCGGDCATTELTANDLFGCGTLGNSNDGNCGVLDVTSANACGALFAPWQCGGGDLCAEAHIVTKLGPEGGGVLCCAD
ncbi:MopE-related protein [Polyangium sp. 15x6]|uniref:MopE-related protein n=1 Tax=Polyangium sp. 15x6 TaxID=3042687 RepID=UPI00249AF3DD|nr:MopE-related protein [Polyangium sp. 15x6]MDI3289140.1 MopE-related protein [Polyangium sp. 15x6]